MTTKSIEIVDRGRGLQLSTSRVTVQDLVPYFQEGCSCAGDNPLDSHAHSRGNRGRRALLPRPSAAAR